MKGRVSPCLSGREKGNSRPNANHPLALPHRRTEGREKGTVRRGGMRAFRISLSGQSQCACSSPQTCLHQSMEGEGIRSGWRSSVTILLSNHRILKKRGKEHRAKGRGAGDYPPPKINNEVIGKTTDPPPEGRLFFILFLIRIGERKCRRTGREKRCRPLFTRILCLAAGQKQRVANRCHLW